MESLVRPSMNQSNDYVRTTSYTGRSLAESDLATVGSLQNSMPSVSCDLTSQISTQSQCHDVAMSLDTSTELQTGENHNLFGKARRVGDSFGDVTTENLSPSASSIKDIEFCNEMTTTDCRDGYKINSLADVDVHLEIISR